MQIVIDIDEKDYKDFQLQAVMLNPAEPSQRAKLAIANGKPLPKGHGRLIDVSEASERMMNARKRFDGITCFTSQLFMDLSEAVVNSTTIVEAEKEGAEE